MSNLIDINYSDTITQINSKISNLEKRETVYLRVRDNDTVLERVVNLKLIKKRAENLMLDMYIVTNNKHLKEIAESLDIFVFSEKEFSDFQEQQNNSESSSSNSSSKNLKIKSKKSGSSNSSSSSNSSKNLKIKKLDISKSHNRNNNNQQNQQNQQNQNIKTVKQKISGVSSAISGTFSKAFSNVFYRRKKSKQRKKIVFHQKNRFIGKVIFSILSISIVVVALVLFIVYPKVEIVLEVERTTEAKEMDFRVSKDISDINISQSVIPGTEKTKKFEFKKTFDAKNFTIIGNTANGKLILYNEQNSSQTLIATTRFQVEGTDLVFRIKNRETIPRATRDADGKLIPGSISVDAYADQPGDHYNVESGNLYVVAFNNYMRKIVYGKINEQFSGGTTEKDITITQEEIDQAKKEFQEEVRNEKTKEVLTQLMNETKDVVLVDGAKDVRITETISSASVGDKSEKFDITVKGEVYVLGFKKQDFEKLTTEVEKKDNNQTVFFDYNIEDFKVKEESMGQTNNVNIKTKINVSKKRNLDEDEIKKSIAGMSRLDAKNTLKEFEGIKGVKGDIKFTPWWFKNIPPKKSSISLKFVDVPSTIQEEQEQEEKQEEEDQTN